MSSLYQTLIACLLLLVATTSGQSFCENTALTCFNEPQDCTTVEDCEFTMTSESVPADNATSFTVTGKSEGWVAIGFSGDKMMGTDDVLMCIWSGDNVQLLERYNEGRSNVAKTNSFVGNGINLEEGTYEDGVISCRFVRENIINDIEHLGLGQDFNFYIMFGRGPLRGNNPAMHDQNPWVSDMPVNLTSGMKITRSTPTPPTQNPNEESSMTTATGTHMVDHSMLLHIIVAALMMIALSL